jgi:hypothetical protein
MVKYKKVKPEITEGFLDKFFAKVATNTATRAVKNIKKKDPKLGKLLDMAQDLRKQGEAHLSKMTKQEREDYLDDMWDQF